MLSKLLSLSRRRTPAVEISCQSKPLLNAAHLPAVEKRRELSDDKVLQQASFGRARDSSEHCRQELHARPQARRVRALVHTVARQATRGDHQRPAGQGASRLHTVPATVHHTLERTVSTCCRPALLETTAAVRFT